MDFQIKMAKIELRKQEIALEKDLLNAKQNSDTSTKSAVKNIAGVLKIDPSLLDLDN